MNTYNKIAFIDLDGTLIKGQSQLLFTIYLVKKRVISPLVFLRIFIYFIFYKFGFIGNTDKVFKKAVSVLKGINKDLIQENAKEFISKTLSKKFYKSSLSLVSNLKNDGYYMVLMSSAIEPIVSNVASLLQFNEYSCTKLFHTNNIFDGNVSGSIVYSEEKANSASKILSKLNIDKKNSVAYGDHLSDFFILKFAGKGFFVNPNKRTTRLATKNGIGVVKFK